MVDLKMPTDIASVESEVGAFVWPSVDVDQRLCSELHCEDTGEKTAISIE